MVEALLLNIQSDQQAAETVNPWDLDCVNAMLKLCEQRLKQSRATTVVSTADSGENTFAPLNG